MYKQYVDDTFIYADIAYILYMCYIKCPVCIYYHKLQLLNSIYVCSLAYFFLNGNLNLCTCIFV